MGMSVNAAVKDSYSELRGIFLQHINVSASDLAERAVELQQEEGVDPVRQAEIDIERGCTEDGTSEEPAPDLSSAGGTVIYADFNGNKQDADEVYYAGEDEEEQEPVTEEEIDEAFEEPVRLESYEVHAPKPLHNPEMERLKREMNEALQRNNMLTSQVSEMQEMMRRMVAHREQKKERKSDTTLYKKDRISFNGRDMAVECILDRVSGRSIGFKTEAESQNFRWENYYAYRRVLTEQVISRIGKTRINAIYVHDNRLIVNGINYVPVVEKDWHTMLPLDMTAYIKNGMVAPFFDWGILPKCHALRVLGFDSMEFVLSYVAEDIGVGRRFGVSTLFKKCDSLDELTIGSETITRDALNKPESAEIKHNVSKFKRFTNIMDGANLNLCSGTQGLQDFFVGSLKEYARNRGDKGFIHYALGTSLRAVGAVASGSANFISHMGKFIVSAFSSATTPIEGGDIGGNEQ